jgi:8-oxo-dGTP diphosphatase
MDCIRNDRGRIYKGLQVKHLDVACGIIEQGGKVLCTQRSASMSMPLKWEFPGGKIDQGETAEDCLRRELAEELGVSINISRALPSHTHQYETYSVTLYSFVSTIRSGEITLHEHVALLWLPPGELQKLDWAEADLPVIEYYLDAYRMRALYP